MLQQPRGSGNISEEVSHLKEQELPEKWLQMMQHNDLYYETAFI